MVSGSLAGSYYGEPRATRDVDIVIDPTARALTRLVDDLLSRGYYVDAEVAQEALADRTQFNAIGPGATKVDFIVRKARAFSIEEFRRRQRADLLGTPSFITTAEDLILAKLEWAAVSDSERQRRDVASIVALWRDLDESYIEWWAAQLGVLDAWRVMRNAPR
ncbi:MAG TPA: hypothetical protein VGQ64_00605 [Candidatus Limnocylindrales bacterium]|nr:hypothetical protein [Candidatus Limnocylindrales bacterium]